MLSLPDLHSWLDTFLMAAALFVALRTLQITKKEEQQAKKPKKKEKRFKRAVTRRKRR